MFCVLIGAFIPTLGVRASYPNSLLNVGIIFFTTLILGEAILPRLLNLVIFLGDGDATDKLIGEVISLFGYHLYFLTTLLAYLQ